MQKYSDSNNASLNGTKNVLRDLSGLSFQETRRVPESQSADNVVAVVLGQGIGRYWLAKGLVQLRMQNAGKFLDNRAIISERYS